MSPNNLLLLITHQVFDDILDTLGGGKFPIIMIQGLKLC